MRPLRNCSPSCRIGLRRKPIGGRRHELAEDKAVEGVGALARYDRLRVKSEHQSNKLSELARRWESWQSVTEKPSARVRSGCRGEP